jgi:hypothetical protein
MEKSAIISNSNLYRYELHRTWDIDKGEVLFIMLNPSTANAWKDDLTTIRCINFAKKWGYGGISIGNIYPFRAKRPKDLKKWLLEPACEEAHHNNEDHVKAMANEADLIVCAWGCNYKGGIPYWLERDFGNLHYLELCKDGVTPKHPLGNLSKDLRPRKFNEEFEINTYGDDEWQTPTN